MSLIRATQIFSTKNLTSSIILTKLGAFLKGNTESLEKLTTESISRIIH